jgi:hypothetical protein
VSDTTTWCLTPFGSDTVRVAGVVEGSLPSTS